MGKIIVNITLEQVKILERGVVIVWIWKGSRTLKVACRRKKLVGRKYMSPEEYEMNDGF